MKCKYKEDKMSGAGWRNCVYMFNYDNAGPEEEKVDGNQQRRR